MRHCIPMIWNRQCGEWEGWHPAKFPA